MKILLLNTYDNKGGAARASYRIAKSINGLGEDLRFIVRKKNLPDTFIYSANEKFSGIKPYLDYLPTFLFTRKRLPFFSAFVKDNLLNVVADFKPDVIHLNWISEGFVKIETLAKFGIPIVWTLHDSWPFTGGCHIPKDCVKYKTECEYCQYLSPKFKSDLSSLNFKRKLRTYNKIENLHIVTPSKWLADEVRSSSLLSKFPVEIIPNCIDNEFYYPVDKQIAKNNMSLDPGKKTVVFGGINSTKDKNKGFELLIDALKYLNKNDLEIVVFGNDKTKIEYLDSIKIIFLGKINDDSMLRKIYSAGDVTVVPSLMEVFGQVITESMSCGTPVVAFNKTGPAEIIDHKKSGYLAEAFDPKDLSDGINWVLEDQQRWNELSENAASHVIKNYSSHVIATKYIDLYKKILL
ncbi:MAG: glycosyltransferase family 4 protein [Bacteroidales bacterium]|nr:glycosyltransferase family 4 protein [Bacteroidales bacterium]